MNRGADAGRLIVWTIVAFLLVGVVMALVMSYGGAPQWMANWAWMMPFGMMLMWVPIVLVIVLFYGLLHRHPPETSASDPDRLLDARYARGEISRDEYLRIRNDLRSGRKR